MPETVKMALSECCQTITNVAESRDKNFLKFPLDKGHFITGFLILSVYWFHPLCWLGYLLLCRDIELACDEKVITEMNANDKQEYSETLLSCSISRRSVAACPLAFGEVAVKERVRGILNYRKPAFWVIIAAIVVCVITAVCFLTNPKKPVAGSDVENVGVRLIGMDLYGEKPSVEYELINHRDEQITFGYEFHIYRVADGEKIDCRTFDSPGWWNLLAFMIESGKSFPFSDSLVGYDFSEKGTYRLEKPFSIGDGVEPIAYIEFEVDKPKFLDKKINGSQYESSRVVYDCGMYSLVTDNISFRLSVSEDYVMSVCESSDESAWCEIGKLEEIKLTEENFDRYLNQSPIWSEGYSAEYLRSHNVRAWRIPGKMVYILSQNNGTVLMACGGDENHFRWIFGMRTVL